MKKFSENNTLNLIELLLDELVLMLFCDVFNLSAFQVALAPVLTPRFFIDKFVALHVLNATNSCLCFSDHEELHASTCC
jgi:hypothetical protein